MKRMSHFACALVAMAARGSTQDEAREQPAELRKLGHMVGNWEGKGMFYPTPDSEGMPWTSVGSVQWILNGHFLLEDVRIDVGPMMPVPIQFRTLYGWDAERQIVFTRGVGNMGGGNQGELHWLDEHTIANYNSGVEEGQPFVERGITDLSDDSFVMERATAGGPFAAYVDGESKKCEKGFSALSEEADVAAMPASEAMQRVTRMVGSYSYSGKMRPAPGEPQPVTGELTIERMFGGHALAVHVLPGGGRPEMWGFVSWNDREHCYDYFTANAEGRSGVYQARPDGSDMLVFTSMGSSEGMALLERMTLALNDDGSPRSLKADVLRGASDAVRVMELSYTKRDAVRAVEARFKDGSCCARADAAGKACTHPCCVAAAAKGEVCAACN